MKAQALTWEDYRRKRWLLQDYIKSACKHNNGETNVRLTEKSIKAGLTVPVMFMRENKIIGLMTLELAEDRLNVTTIAGDFDKGWAGEVVPILTKIAQSQKRRIICGKGRKGWIRHLKQYGFKLAENNYLEATV